MELSKIQNEKSFFLMKSYVLKVYTAGLKLATPVFKALLVFGFLVYCKVGGLRN